MTTRTIFASLLVPVASLAAAVPAWSHPGHGTIPAEEPSHYFLEPVHALVWVAVMAVAMIAAVVIFRKPSRSGERAE